MEVIRQSALPPGTAYFECGNIRTIAASNSNLRFCIVFDPNDGLYATPYSRSLWKEFPYKHPHALLFEILYNKLQSYQRISPPKIIVSQIS
jgi:hypothetical protein